MIITTERKIQCLERELTLRYRVYPRLVGKGNMTQAAAQEELEVLETILSDYQARLQFDIFDQGETEWTDPPSR